MVLSTLLSTLAFGSAVRAQLFNGPVRPPGSFTNIQPVDTVVLTQYNSSEPVYPSPRVAGGVPGWEEGLQKARDFLSQLTLEEKSLMVTGVPGPCVGNIYGIPRLNFTGLCLQDGPQSLRVQNLASVFASGVTVASSWDRQLLYDRGLAMGREFRGKGAHVALAPVAGPLGRSAYMGRNWEGFSADPYLTGVAMSETIQGIQDAGVQAAAKHFIGNEQEIQRNNNLFPNLTVQYEAISSNIDDRTFHEIYLWPFANAAKAKSASFMCSYQRLNGSYACQNSKALNGILKDELGHQGYVMSDWFAVHSGVASIESGLDMDMPGFTLPYLIGGNYSTYFGPNITTAVNNGTLDVARLDDMVLRIMTPYYALGQDQDFPSRDSASERVNGFTPPTIYTNDWEPYLQGEANRDVRDNHGELIRKQAAESTILLKNTNNALPLQNPKHIAVFGNDAGDPLLGPLNQENYEYGTLAVGGGSGAGQFTYLISPLDALKNKAEETDATIEYWLNNTYLATPPAPNLLGTGGFLKAITPDVCLVFLKGWASEGVDRDTLDLDWQANEVVENVAAKCNNTVVVTHSSGINNLPWSDHENVTAILVAHYPGQESGNSIVDVLYGDVNPSGHLPYTIALNGTDYNAPVVTGINTTGTNDWQAYFDEKLEVDYRYFDANNIDVRFEFGFGLSYTTFNLDGVTIEAVNTSEISAIPEQRTIQPGGNPALWDVIYRAQVFAYNTGDIRGYVVPQLYVTFPSSTPGKTPPYQLRGFDKVDIVSGERRLVEFDLMRRDLSYWDVEVQQWRIPEGEFTLHVGLSSRQLLTNTTLTVIESGSGGTGNGTVPSGNSTVAARSWRA